MADIDLDKVQITEEAWQGETVTVIYQARNVNQVLTAADDTPQVTIYKGDHQIGNKHDMTPTTTPGVYIFQWQTENFSPGEYRLVADAVIDGEDDITVLETFNLKDVN